MSLENLGKSVIYMGTPEFAVAPLKALIQANVSVVAVVTVADKPAGRGRKLHESAVKIAAIEFGIPVLQPTSLKDATFLAELASFNADLFIVVAFRMLPEAVWNMPPFGTFNLHGSLLPAYRGAAPINWAIINGETKTGVTTFFLDKDIDTGSIIRQSDIHIEDKWTAGELHDAMMPLGADLVVDTVHSIFKGQCTLQSQSSELATHAPKLNRENCRLDFTKSPSQIISQIKGLSPFPGAYFGDYKFINAAVCAAEISSINPVLFRLKGGLFLKYSKGNIEITSIKAAGKRQMSGKDFANGMQIDELPLI
ncbi:MAG: methionyl-tRNA formyltransferase [Schleiferiaceae bacterium]|jgi:methionyl-tRNA formyltransferase|nr:methionyl-tRNA formyltransferase [Schleiferiaceae bacterium]MDG1313762.1 methionyl-tRNA formyltransferase [Schleiferiaceae bacterium]MDG1918340.1 methionyl-tRNA formyltransferase [Schleiferiaceae bacterium]MDG2110656.1 methionyl-tRNA formyltransferase [Schleiferiaceae bacterium]